MEEITKEIEDCLVEAYGKTLREHGTSRMMAEAVVKMLADRLDTTMGNASCKVCGNHGGCYC